MSGGTCLVGPASGSVKPVLLDESGYVHLGLVAGAPSNGLAGYAVSCILQRTDAAGLYVNKGTAASATWSAVTLP